MLWILQDMKKGVQHFHPHGDIDASLMVCLSYCCGVSHEAPKRMALKLLGRKTNDWTTSTPGLSSIREAHRVRDIWLQLSFTAALRALTDIGKNGKRADQPLIDHSILFIHPRITSDNRSTLQTVVSCDIRPLTLVLDLQRNPAEAEAEAEDLKHATISIHTNGILYYKST